MTKTSVSPPSTAVSESVAPSRAGSDLWPMLLLAAVWMIAVILVDPRGNFPLNDDWCYSRSVFDLLRTHEFRMAGVTTMTLFAQVLWGALFCSIFGASYAVLRISTLVLGFGGLLAAYGLIRETKASRWTAFFGCLVIALNPLYLVLSHSFMTDVPFAAVSLMALYTYVRALKHGSVWMIVLGTVLACIAVLIRQLGIMLPVGFAFGLLVKDGMKVRSITRAVIPVAVVGLTLVLYLHWLGVTDRLPAFYAVQDRTLREFMAEGPRTWLASTLGAARMWYVYLGLFTLPFTTLSLQGLSRTVTRRQDMANSAVALVSALVVAYSLVVGQTWMPLAHTSGDYILDFGMGPANLGDVTTLSVPNYPTAPGWLWVAVTIAGVAGGALLFRQVLAAVELLVDRKATAFDKGTVACIVVAGLIYISPTILFFRTGFLDRYLLCSVPMLIIMAALAIDSSALPGRLCIAGGLLALVMLGGFGICGTHDYLSWNRARWQALDDLMRNRHVDVQEIEGGYEFKNSLDYDDVNLERNWWWNEYHRYLIAFGPAEGYDVEKRFTYRRWMPPGDAAIYVLRRY